MAKAIRDQGLDKFYTNSPIAKMCIDSVEALFPLTKFDTVIEPSAGNGSFFNSINHSNKIGIDISPECPDIIKMNFFRYTPDRSSKLILVIGNPPFGRVSSIAVKFFNHAAQWANVIAFIIPKTFRKTSIQNRLDLNFSIVADIDIPDKPCSFTPAMSVKCCFQIWKKNDNIREIINLPESHSDWVFLKLGPKDVNNQPTPPKGADFAIRAYGGKCGFIENSDLELLRPKSWHWIKANIPVAELIKRFELLDYSNSSNTARQNSIGKKELIQLYEAWLNSISE